MMVGLAKVLASLLMAHTTRLLAGWWWVSLVLVAFGWGIVPAMRRRHNIMERDDFSRSARFWWAPGWPWFGLVGAGVGLIDAPLLHPYLAAQWAPGAWWGLTANISLEWMTFLVLSGVMAILVGLRGFLTTWVYDREMRYRAWRWRLGSRPRCR